MGGGGNGIRDSPASQSLSSCTSFYLSFTSILSVFYLYLPVFTSILPVLSIIYLCLFQRDYSRLGDKYSDCTDGSEVELFYNANYSDGVSSSAE